MRQCQVIARDGATPHECSSLTVVDVWDSNGERQASPLTPAERVAFAFVLVGYLLLSLLVFNQIEEDAFIDFRQAANLVDGYGFTFNRGGEPVEAASSLLWMLLLVLFWRAPLDIVITAKLLGITAGCLSLWLLLCLSRRHVSNSVLRIGAPVLTVASVPFLMWSQRGLETPLVVLIVLWLALCLTDRRWFPWWPAAAVLLLVVRPEGPLFLLALLPALGVDRDRWRAALPGIVIVGLSALALLSARLLYFHDLAPSPFYVKLHTGGGEGLEQIRKFLVHNHVAVLAMPLLLVTWRRTFWNRERVVFGVLVVIAAAWCALAKDYMPYLRHLVPAIPLLYLLLCAATDALVAGLPRGRAAAAVVYISAGVIATLFLSRSTMEFTATGENALGRYVRALAADPKVFASATVAKLRQPLSLGVLDEALGRYGTIGSTFQALVGEFLRRNYAGDSVVVYDQMGQTPYYAGATMRFIDTLGITDRTIGRYYFERRKRDDVVLRAYEAVASWAVETGLGEGSRQVTEAAALDYVFGLQPDLILIGNLVAELEPASLAARLSDDARFAERYELRYRLARFVLLYERRGTPRKQKLDVPFGLGVVEESPRAEVTTRGRRD